jgi:long-chain fatty acid transport protein
MNLSKLLIALAATGFVSSAFATNGDVLIGLGPQSRAMGGTGTAAFFGSENALTNPALIGKSKGTEFSIGGTFFMPDVHARNDAAANFGVPGSSADSDSDLSMIPEVSLSTRINDNLTFGLGMFGSAGMGVDYRGNANLFNAYTNLQLMKFAPTIAYNSGNFGVGFAPVLQYGSLDINYTDGGSVNRGSGASSDLKWGFNLGGYFDVTPELTLGLAYQSPIKMKYKDQLSVASLGFLFPGGLTQAFGDNLEQPAEIKVGIAYTTGPWMVTGDYKQVNWSSAAGYKSFNWKNQDVYALGMKYKQKGYWVGVGYNHGNDPIDVLPTVVTSGNNQIINMFNNLMFPGIVEDHFTLGGGIAVGQNTSVDLALTYADKVNKSVSITQLGGSTLTTTHSQVGATIAMRMNF